MNSLNKNGFVFYHGSNADFDWPSLDVIDVASDSKPLKVLLGLYVTTYKDFASRCGKNVYEIVLSENTPFVNLPISEMVSRHYKIIESPLAEARQKYLDIRAEYISNGYGIVHITEENPDMPYNESVIVNFNFIKSFRKT